MDILTLVQNISLILSYIIPGYIFLLSYHSIKHHCLEKWSSNVLLKSVVASYFLSNICLLGIKRLVPSQVMISDPVVFVFSIVLGVAGGYALARFSSWDRLNDILMKIGIRRTVNDGFWDDIIKSGSQICAISYGNKSYVGQCSFYEPDTAHPLIALSYYQVFDSDFNLIEDYGELGEKQRVAILDTKNFDRIDVIYDGEANNTVAPKSR